MGTYFAPANVESHEMLYSHDYNEMMEIGSHSHFGSRLIDAALNEIYVGCWKNKPFAWISHSDRNVKYAETVEKNRYIKTYSEYANIPSYGDAIIVNNTKQEFIDLAEFKAGWLADRSEMTHPFPLLTNSQKECDGMGDYEFEWEKRGSWAGDAFVVTFDRFQVPGHYKNVSREVYFYVGEEQRRLDGDAFAFKAKTMDKTVDDDFNDKVYRYLDKSAEKWEVIRALQENDQSWLTFMKADHSVVTRMASLRKDHEPSGEKNPANDKYLWFYDVEEEKMKRCIFENFKSLEKA